MPPIIWIDGTYYGRGDAKVSVFDHGLLYGDGVFEGIRVYNRRVFRLAQHLDRLYASAKGIWLEIPLAKPAMHRLVEEAVEKSELEDAYLRLVVTRGVGDLGLDPRKCPKPSVICIVDTIQLWSPERYEHGLTALTAPTPISHRESLSPRIKSLNYLAHILAKVEELQLGPTDVVAQTASQCFDISVWQFMAALAAGAQVRVFSAEDAADPRRILARTVEGRVTVLEIVPSLLRAVLDDRAAVPEALPLRWLLLTGEALPARLTSEWLRLHPAIPIVNAYGPTECSDDVTHEFVRGSDDLTTATVSIGRPIRSLTTASTSAS